MVDATTRDERIGGLVRIGEKELTGEDEAAVDAYFAPDFRFHGPDGREWDYQGLKGYFAALRAAFDDLTIRRGIIVVEGDHVAFDFAEGKLTLRNTALDALLADTDNFLI